MRAEPVSLETGHPPPTRASLFSRWWVGGAISLAAIYLALRNIDAAQTFQILAEAPIEWVALGLLVSFATLFAKAARWLILLRARRQLRPGLAYKDALASQSIGIFVNIFIPARLGDLARVYLFCARNGGSRSQALGTIGVEKLLDLVFLLASLAVWLPGVIYPDWFLEPLKAISAMVGMVIAGCLVFAMRPLWWQSQLRRLAQLIRWKWAAWLVQRVEWGLSSLGVLREPRRLLAALVVSLLIWFLGVLTNLSAFWACRLFLSLDAAVFLLAALQVGVAVPSSPGRLGVFHYLTLLSLGVFGIGGEAGLAVGILLHGLVMLPIALLGGVSIFLYAPRSWGSLVNNMKNPPGAGET